jgi:hypothetical protein
MQNFVEAHVLNSAQVREVLQGPRPAETMPHAQQQQQQQQRQLDLHRDPTHAAQQPHTASPAPSPAAAGAAAAAIAAAAEAAADRMANMLIQVRSGVQAASCIRYGRAARV